MANLCISTTLRNVGKNKYDVVLAAFAYFIPTDREFTKEELETAAATIAALRAGALLSRSALNKVFILPKFSDVADNTEAPASETLGDGRIQIGVEKAPAYTLEYPLGFCQAQAIGAFNGYNGRGYVVDSNGVLLFVNKPDGGGKPFTVSNMYTTTPRPGAYTGKRVVTTNISFANADEWRNISAVRISLGDLTGIPVQEDVQLYEAAAAAGLVFTIGGKTACVNTEIYDAYADALNDPSAWTVTRLDTNAVVTVSATAKDAANKGWDLTLSNTPAITAGTKLRFDLNLTAIQADDIFGIEGISVIATAP